MLQSKPSTSESAHVELRSSSTKPFEKPNRSSSVLIERRVDGRKFKKVKLSDLQPMEGEGSKPNLPDDLDLGLLREQYYKTIRDLRKLRIRELLLFYI